MCTGRFAGVHVASPTPEEYISGNIGGQRWRLLCFTDEEAAVLSADPNGSGGLPTPSDAACAAWMVNWRAWNDERWSCFGIWREPDVEATFTCRCSGSVSTQRKPGVEHGAMELERCSTRMCVRPIWDATNGHFPSVSCLPHLEERCSRMALESLLKRPVIPDEEAE